MVTDESEKTIVDKVSRKEHKNSKKSTEKKAPGEKEQAKDPTEAAKKTRKEEKKKLKEEKRKNRKPRRRIFPIWLRIIFVLILFAVALIVGLMVGFGVIGDGNPKDALELETWQHIIDIVTKKE